MKSIGFIVRQENFIFSALCGKIYIILQYSFKDPNSIDKVKENCENKNEFKNLTFSSIYQVCLAS